MMDYYRKVSPLEGNKNVDSLLKKLVCRNACGWVECRWVHVQAWVGSYVCVHVGRCGEGLK